MATALEIVKALYPLHRTLVSDGTDEALQIVGREMPDELEYRIETYAPTLPVWTWRVPERYVVHEAYLEDERSKRWADTHGEQGRRIGDFAENPLHLVSYSPPIDKWMDWDELAPHLRYSESRPDAIPWVYKFYERDWGFCLSKREYDALPRNRRYHAVIRSEFVADPEQGLRLGVAALPARGLQGEILLLAHICHPMQANDDASGVAVLVEVARRLTANPLPAPHYGVRFLFGPETIGTVCYLSQHEDIAAGLKAGIFVEMAGTDGSVKVQASQQGDADIDQIALKASKAARAKYDWRCWPFRSIIGNDEIVVNGPGIDVPCISLSRWPYPEYHTSDDTPEIIKAEKLAEMADAVEAIVRVAATDYTPVRRFTGPICLSAYGLHKDQSLNHYQKEVTMSLLDGEHSLWQIASKATRDSVWWATNNDANYWAVRQFVEQLRERGLAEVRE